MPTVCPTPSALRLGQATSFCVAPRARSRHTLAATDTGRIDVPDLRDSADRGAVRGSKGVSLPQPQVATIVAGYATPPLSLLAATLELGIPFDCPPTLSAGGQDNRLRLRDLPDRVGQLTNPIPYGLPGCVLRSYSLMFSPATTSSTNVD